MREGERRKKETRLSQTFTTKGWTDLFLAGLVWLHLICFGLTILDLLMRQLCVANLAVSCSRPLGSVVASAGRAQRSSSMMLCRIAETIFRESSRTEELTTLTAKQHFSSHAHISIVVEENKRSLLCITHTKKILDNEMH